MAVSADLSVSPCLGLGARVGFECWIRSVNEAAMLLSLKPKTVRGSFVACAALVGREMNALADNVLNS